MITKCDVCGKITAKPYWCRAFPDVLLCQACFDDPPDELVRRKIAAELWRIRKEHGVGVAHLVYNMLKGTGVPPKRPS